MNKMRILVILLLLACVSFAGTYTTDDIITKSPVVDVRAFLPSGYVVDGSVDYTTEIQAAIDASRYRSLYIPAGVYKITSTLVLDGTYQYNIYGDTYDPDGVYGTVINNAGVGNAFTITAAGNNMVKLSRMCIKGSQTTNSGVAATNVHNLVLEDMWIRANGRYGVALIGSHNVKLNRITVTHNGRYGIRVDQCNNLTISNSTINANSRLDGYGNIEIIGTSGSPCLIVNIENCDISSAGQSGVWETINTCWNLTAKYVKGLNITGNYLELTAGVLLYMGTEVSNVDCRGNYFQDGLVHFDTITKSTIANNVFHKDSVDTELRLTVSADNSDNRVWGNRLTNGATQSFTGLTQQRSEQYDTGAPGAGTWAVKDIAWNTTPSAGGNIGWVCVAAGTPGTWKTFGVVSMPFGEISVVSNAVETTIAAQNVYVQVTIFDTNGENNNATPDHTNDHITITKAGRYFISCSITLNSIGGSGSTAEIEVKKNNGASRVGALHVDRTLAGGGAESGAITLTGFANLAVDDTIEVWIKNETNTQNYVVEDITLSLMQIGG